MIALADTVLFDVRSAKPRAVAYWKRIQARFVAVEEKRAPTGRLYLTVSSPVGEATHQQPDGGAPETIADWHGEGALPVPDVLRRATRVLRTRHWERVDSVSLLVADPDIALLDSRAARIRTADPVAIRHAGTQLLGSKGSLFGFQPFGFSSESELPRGVYAFASVDKIRDYLGSLDALAVRLIGITPIAIPMLTATQTEAFVAIDVRASGMTALFADPETGMIAHRELTTGTRHFAEAIAAATSITLGDAVEGLARRDCFPATDGARVITATERALQPILASLRSELSGYLEYFAFERLATYPQRLILTGEVSQIRGLADWLGRMMELPLAFGRSPHERLGEEPISKANLIHDAPNGLLQIGTVEYRFIDGRFRPDPAHAGGRVNTAQMATALRQPLTLSLVRRLVRGVAHVRLILPLIMLAALCALLSWTVEKADADLEAATAILAQARSEEAGLHRALWQRLAAEQGDGDTAEFPWTERLLAIAKAVPAGMALTKVSLPALSAGAAKERRLVLEGAIPLGTSDYMAAITSFTDRLSSDAAFRRNVSVMSFEGAVVVYGPLSDSVRFTVSVRLRDDRAGHP